MPCCSRRTPIGSVSTVPQISGAEITIAFLIEGLKKAVAHKAISYNKLRETTQTRDENPAQFWERLVLAVQKFSVDPEGPGGQLILRMHFISQSAPDIKKKPQKLDLGPQTPQWDLTEVAFKVF